MISAARFRSTHLRITHVRHIHLVAPPDDNSCDEAAPEFSRPYDEGSRCGQSIGVRIHVRIEGEEGVNRRVGTKVKDGELFMNMEIRDRLRQGGRVSSPSQGTPPLDKDGVSKRREDVTIIELTRDILRQISEV